MPGAKNVLSALLNKNVLKQMLKCFHELVSNILNRGPCCFYTSMSQVIKEEREFNQSSIFFLRSIRVVLSPAASKIYKKCQWGITSCWSISKILWQISLLVVNIRPQPHPCFIDYNFSLIKENSKSRSFSWRWIFIYLVARNQIKKITF